MAGAAFRFSGLLHAAVLYNLRGCKYPGEMTMRILIINPNSDENTDQILIRKAKAFSLPGVEVDVIHVKKAPRLICTYEDRAASAEEMAEIIRSTADKFDAYVVACHGDPNLDLAREISGKPVVGMGECSMKYAAAMGNGYAVISPSLKFVSRKIALAHKYHTDDLLRTVVAAKSSSREDLLEACRTAKNTFGVDVIVLGCANYSGCDAYLEREVGIPVLDGLVCALITAAGLAHYQKYKKFC